MKGFAQRALEVPLPWLCRPNHSVEARNHEVDGGAEATSDLVRDISTEVLGGAFYFIKLVLCSLGEGLKFQDHVVYKPDKACECKESSSNGLDEGYGKQL